MDYSQFERSITELLEVDRRLHENGAWLLALIASCAGVGAVDGQHKSASASYGHHSSDTFAWPDGRSALEGFTVIMCDLLPI